MAKSEKDIDFNIINIPPIKNIFNQSVIPGNSNLITENFYGFNTNAYGTFSQQPQNSNGYVFFTKPMMNLSSYNLAMMPNLYNLVSTDKKSIANFIRQTLDPRIMGLKKSLGKGNVDVTLVKSPLLDATSGFIPILSNSLISLTGWPDIMASAYTTNEGWGREQWSMFDGIINVNNAYTLDCTFSNILGEAVIIMIQTWLRYMDNVYQGYMLPYLDMISNNEMDYNTRIYRIILDKTQSYCKKICACGSSFPLNIPTGREFDYNYMDVYLQENKEFSVEFQCTGFIQNEPYLIKDFNMTTAIFNERLRKWMFKYNFDKTKLGEDEVGYYIANPINEPMLSNIVTPIIDPYDLSFLWLADMKNPKFKLYNKKYFPIYSIDEKRPITSEKKKETYSAKVKEKPKTTQKPTGKNIHSEDKLRKVNKISEKPGIADMSMKNAQ